MKYMLYGDRTFDFDLNLVVKSHWIDISRPYGDQTFDWNTSS